MTAPRCEPPPELRNRDGWHWLTHERWGEWPTRYMAPEHAGIWPLWVCPDSNWTTPAAYREGWRYVAPVATTDEVEALRAEASEWCQSVQLLQDRVHRQKGERDALAIAFRKLSAVLRVNMLRHGPLASHAEIDAAIDACLGPVARAALEAKR